MIEKEHSFTDTSISLSAELDTSTVPYGSNNYMNDTTPSFQDGDAGDVITLVLTGPEGTQTLTTKVDSNGRWQINANELTADGEYTWQVIAEDIAGTPNSIW